MQGPSFSRRWPLLAPIYVLAGPFVVERWAEEENEGKEEGSEVQYIVPAEYIALRAYFYSAVLYFVMDSFIAQDRNEHFESG